MRLFHAVCYVLSIDKKYWISNKKITIIKNKDSVNKDNF
jgi:hypothetical protein